jgi:predicted ATPase
MKIESIRLKNFRMFREVSIKHLPNCCVFVGANGTGKTSLFDVLRFLRDALTYNVKQALARRGGFKEVVSRGTAGPIELELKCRDLETISSIATYLLVIELVENQPVVKREVLKSQQGDGGEVRHFLDFSLGKGTVIYDENDSEQLPHVELKPEEKQLESATILALKGIGQLKKFKLPNELRRFFENGHFSELQISEAKKVNSSAGYDEHLSSTGDNLALYAQTLYNNYPKRYGEVMREMARRVPGLAKIEPVTEKGRIFLEFHHELFKEPFQLWQVSDGTLQLFAYMLLLYDPNPYPLLCAEEPEHQIYPDLLMLLAEEFSGYAGRGEGQVFVSTHSPDFLNGTRLERIFWLTPKNGYTEIHTTAEEPLLKRLVDVGDLPGALWKQGFFEGAHPW